MGIDAHGACRREQSVGLVTQPVGPGRSSRDDDQLTIVPHIGGHDGPGVIARQSSGENCRELAHLAGAPYDLC